MAENSKFQFTWWAVIIPALIMGAVVFAGNHLTPIIGVLLAAIATAGMEYRHQKTVEELAEKADEDIITDTDKIIASLGG